MRAAIAAGYGIETDVQISADGEAMVHHDDVLGRLTEGEGRLDRYSADELKRVPFRDSAERMMTLGESLRSRRRARDHAGRAQRPLRRRRTACRPASPKSSKPIAGRRRRCRSTPGRSRHCAVKRPASSPASSRQNTGRIRAANRCRLGSDTAWAIFSPASPAHAQFVAYGVADLPAFAPMLARHVLRMPLLTWTVRTEAERLRAARFADQMIFEGFRP